MIKCPCQMCDRRTIEPNCHNPTLCDAWRAYREAKDREQDARNEAAMLDGSNNLRMVKSKTRLGYTYVLGDNGGRRYDERKKRRIPGGTMHKQR